MGVASFFAGQYFRNPCNLKFKILLVFIMHVEVRSQFFKAKSEWVSFKLWLSSYGMTLYDSCVSECLILGACNCNAKMCRLVWMGYIVAGQATLYHRYVIILLLLLLLLLQYKNSYFCTMAIALWFLCQYSALN